MRIALIHDYLTTFGGAEKTFKSLVKLFPGATVYTLFYDQKIKKKFFPKTEIRTSFLQKFPTFLKKRYRLLLPFLPIAVETLDFREFDLVISSSFSFSKGIITRPKTKHVCYCYSPTRYLWDAHKPNFILNYFRIWDRQAADRVDKFIAISKTVQKRIKKYYQRSSTVIYPAVKTSNIKLQASNNFQEEFFLIVSQLRKYKQIDLAIRAFNKLGLKLIIIGEGPEKNNLKKIAKENIKFLGWQSNKIVNKYYQTCSAFVFPGEDDFGIAPVEAMAHGKPVLAYKKGGATETIIEGKTGEFFNSCLSRQPDGENISSVILVDGMRRLRKKLITNEYNPESISSWAQKFSQKRFEKELLAEIKKVVKGS